MVGSKVYRAAAVVAMGNGGGDFLRKLVSRGRNKLL